MKTQSQTIAQFFSTPQLTDQEQHTWSLFTDCYKVLTIISISAYGLEYLSQLQNVIDTFRMSEAIEVYQHIKGGE